MGVATRRTGVAAVGVAVLFAAGVLLIHGGSGVIVWASALLVVAAALRARRDA